MLDQQGLMTCLILMQKLTDLLLVVVVVSFCCITHTVYQHELQLQILQRESHPLCKDTPTQTAWVSYRDGEARCFLEYDDFPHRAKGYSIK
jgi:hypothetical protein